MNSVNKIPLLSFCVKKTNHSTYLTPGCSGDDSVHVSSVITPTLCSENVWGEAFSDNKRYLLLLSVRFGDMTTRFFLPTNPMLILEQPTHIISYIVSYHIVSYCIIPYHISYRIISHHVISYHIISYHLISYHNDFQWRLNLSPNYKSRLVLCTKRNILSICSTGCANVSCRYVFCILETSVWRFMIELAWVISQVGSYLLIWGPPISIKRTVSNNYLIPGTQKTVFSKKSVFLADWS
jgi:hypothetical protein